MTSHRISMSGDAAQDGLGKTDRPAAGPGRLRQRHQCSPGGNFQMSHLQLQPSLTAMGSGMLSKGRLITITSGKQILRNWIHNMSSTIPKADLESFGDYLKRSDRVIALLGAGLSASSGLPTFRGVGGLWRRHEATSLATPEAFAQDAALVWQFYSYRRHMALSAQPNPAHYALAELARRNPHFITLSQNVDGIASLALSAIYSLT